MVLQTSGTITHRNIANEFLVPQNQVRGLSNSFSFTSDTYIPSAPIIPVKGQFRSESYYYGKQNAPEWAIGSLYLTAGSTTIQSVVCDSGNNVFVGGFFTGILTLFNFNGTRSNVYMAAGTQDAFVAKYSPAPTSNVLWAARMTSTGNDAVLSVSADPGGNVFATGYYTGLMNIYSSSSTYVSNLAQFGGQDVFLVKYGPSGEVLWGARAGSSGTDVATGVSIDSSGSAYVTGYYTASMYLYNSSNVLYASQGYPGGNGVCIGTNIGNNSGGGGGGGAGQAGTDAFILPSGFTDAGKGGDGRQYGISGTLTYYGGGGGGGIWTGNSAGFGGLGGGGRGGINQDSVGTPGTNGLGGGSGGSGANANSGSPTAPGGSGIVIMSYMTGSITASGGTITTSAGNTIHRYTVVGSNTFTVTSGGNLNMLLVGGGGGGGVLSAGGGGGGGVIYQESIPVTARTYTVVVGAGGPATTVGNASGNTGNPSYFSPSPSTVIPLYAQGGGGGGGNLNPSKPGGSGGGGGFNTVGKGGNVSMVSQLMSYGGQDVFLAKYDADGNVVWAGRGGSAGADAGNGVATDPSGNVFMTGYYTGTMSFYDSSSQLSNTLAQYGGQDVFLVKYNPYGQVLWGARAGSAGTDLANAVASDATGNVFVTGNYNGVMSFPSINTAAQYSTSNTAFVYPPAPMTAATTVSALPTGSYIASASTNFVGNEPFRAFNYHGSSGWISGAASFAATTGAYNGVLSTTIDGTAYRGEWLQIQMPTQVSLTAYKLVNTDTVPIRTPKTWKLAGSNNGSTWIEIDSKTNSAPISGAIITPAPNSNSLAAYSYFRIVSNAVVGTTAASYVTITELSLYSNVGYKYPVLIQIPAFTSAQDAFLAKYDPNGNILWGARGVSSGTDAGTSVAADSTGNVYMTGNYNGALYLIGNTYVSSSNVSAFVYPPYAMTAAAISFPEGTYIASASTNTAGEDPFRAFNNSNAIPGWTTSTASYAATTGTYSGVVSTTINGSAYLGEWLQLRMPQQIVLNSYYLTSNQASNVSQTSDVRTPKSWKIAGSVDETNWVELDSQTSVPTGLITVPSNSNTTVGYSYFRLAVNQIKGALTTQFCSIAELYLYSNTGQTSNVLPQISGQDVFVAKYGPDGDVLWGARSGSTGTDIINGMALNSQGNVYVTGTISTNVPMTTYASNGVSIPNTILPPGTTQYGFIESLNPSGNVVGTMTIGTFPTSSYNVTSVCYDKTGNIYATGGYTGYLQLYNSDGTFQTTGFVSNAVQSAFLAKYTSNGNVIWSAPLQSTGTSIGNSVSTDATGNVFVTGNYTGPMMLYSSTGTEFANTLAQYGGQDVFLAKYGPSGEVLWGARAGSSGTDVATGVSIDSSGSAYVTGYYTASMYLYNSSNVLYASQGYPGGNGVCIGTNIGNNSGGGGGGGAGQAGTDAFILPSGFTDAGKGGDGRQYGISGTLTYYGGGGGGGIWTGNSAGFGGLGGGGRGGINQDSVGTPGTNGLGGGSGGSGANANSGSPTAPGGSGIVIMSYMTGSITASGGTITTSAGNTIHRYTVVGSNTFTVTSGGNLNMLLVGGGGGGGVLSAGGGGGGGVIYQESIPVTARTYTVVVGAGGPATTVGNASGNTGNPSYFSPSPSTVIPLYAQGGGGGGGNLNPSKPGGSGGGGGFNTVGKGGNVSMVSQLMSYGGQDVFLAKYDADGNVVWAGRGGSAGADAGNGVATDPSGNVFMTGYYTGTMSFYDSSSQLSNTLAQYGGQDVFLVKYNPYGQVLWGARTGSPGTDAATALATDATGNVYVTGYYAGLMNIYSSSNTYVSNLAQYVGQDVFLVKYGPSGEVHWGARTGSPGTDSGNGVAVDVTGNVYVSGFYAGLMNLYSSSNVYVSNLAQISGQDVFVAQYDLNGNVLGAARAGSSGTDTSTSIACDPTRFNTVCFGGTMGAASTFYKPLVNRIIKNYTSLSTGYTSLLTFPTNPTPYWSLGLKTSGITDTETITSSTVDTDGNVFVAGYFTGSSIGIFPNVYVSYNSDGTVTSNMYSQTVTYQNAFLTKYNSTGTVLWSATLESATGTSAVNGIASDPTGNVYVTGYYTGLMNLYSSSKTYVSNLAQFGGQDVFLVKYGPSGEVIWGARTGSPGTDTGNGVSTDLSGNVYVIGNYTGLMSIYSSSNTYVSSLSQYGGQDVFLVKYGPSGQVLWGTRAGSTGTDAGNSVSTDLSGNVYVTGNYTGLMSILNSNTAIQRNVSNVSAFLIPPIPMTTGTTTSALPPGNYIASASTNFAGEDPFRAFNKSNTIPGWTTSTASYAATTGTYTGAVSTTINGSAYLGEWLQLQTPTVTTVTSYYLTSFQSSNVSQTSDVRTPKSWKLAGSTNGSTWIELDSQTSVPTGIITLPSSSNTANSYNYFRFAVNQIKGAATTQSCSIMELYLYSNIGYTYPYLAQYGGQDVFLAKYDPSGQALWGATMGSPGTDVGNGVATDAAGDVYVTGYYTGLMNIYSSSNVYVSNLTQISGQDVFLIKYGSSGEVLWGSKMGSSGVDSGNGVSTDEYGNVYITGQYSGEMNFYNSSGVSAIKQIQGNIGGTYYGGSGLLRGCAGGGGGAGTVGGNGIAGFGGAGGNGLQYAISGTPTYYGGGGGGSVYGGTGGTGDVGGAGGLGGGGDGGYGTNAANGLPGTDGLGGGGGGSSQNSLTNSSGRGGNGAVIISYATGTLSATGGTMTAAGGNTIHTYTVSGSNTFVVTSRGIVNTLLVGGGGSGGATVGGFVPGGGGAGGVTYTEGVTISPRTYPVIVGTGAAAVTAVTPSGIVAGLAGSPSIFLNIVAGGGGGGNRGSAAGVGPSGASSGGGSNLSPPAAITIYNAMQSIGGNDVFVAKYRSSGEILWYTAAGSSGSDIGTSAKTDATGNVYVTGTYNGIMNLYSSANTYVSNLALLGTTQSGFLAKYDQFGFVQNTNRSGSTAPTGSSITVSAISIAQSNIYVTGYMTGLSVFYSSSNVLSSSQNVSTQDVFVAKYSQTGNVYWVSKMTSTGADSGVGVATDPTGNVYVNGTYTGPLTIYNSSGSAFSNVLPQVGGSDAFLVKYDTNGNVIWAAYQGSTGTDGGSCIGTDPSGNVYTVGYYTGTMNIYSSSNVSFSNTFAQINANQCVFLAKYSPNGQVLWGARSGIINSGGASTMSRMFVESSGNVYVTGSGTNGNYRVYHSNTATAFQIGGSGGSTNGFAFKYDPNGNAKWLMYVTNDFNNNNGQAITGDNLGNIYVSGILTFSATSLYSTTFDSSTISLVANKYTGYVLQMNSNGRILNAAGISGGGFTTMTCESTGLGFVYILIYAPGATFYDYSGSATGSLPQIGGQDVYILKMRPSDGTAVWTNRAGSSGTDTGTYIALDSTNSMIVYGGIYPNATISFYDSSTAQIYSVQSSLGGATNSFLSRFPLV